MTLIRCVLVVLAGTQGIAACARGPERPVPDTSSAAVTSADTALARADSLYLERDIDGARAIWVPALASAEARGDSERVALLLTSLGLAHRSQGEYAQARDLLERSLTLKQRLGMRADLFRSLNALGLLASDEGRLSDAMSFYQRAADAALAQGDSLSAAKAGHNRGLIHHRLGDFDRAREGFTRLRDVARASGDTVSLARALNNVAMLDVTSGNTLSAIAALDEIRRLAGASGDVELQENAFGQLALAFDELGDGRRAFALLDSALALTRKHGLRRQEAEDLRLMGDLYRDAGDYRRALDSFAGARSIVESLELPEETGDVLLSEAEAQYALGQVELAKRRASDALRMHRSGGFRFAELIDLCVLAEIAQMQRRPGEALAYLRSARVLADALDSDFARADVTIAEARVADLAGSPATVLAALDARSAPAVADDWEAHALRARAYARLGRLEAAAAAGRQALAGVERVRGGYPAGTLRSLYTSAKSDIYADQVLVLLRLGRVAEAFEVADAGRGRALVEHLAVARDDIRRSSGSGQALAEAERLLARIDTLVARLREAQLTRPPERGTTGADERELASQLVAARSAYETLLVRATREDPAAAALLGAARSDAGAVQRSLMPDEALIAYTVTDDRLLTFVVTRDSIRSITASVAGDELANRVRLARELLARHDLDASQSSSVLKGLYRLLLGEAVPMLEQRGTRRLLIVPHRSLAYLPFAALQDDNGRFLVQRFSLIHLSAASVLPAIRSPARARSPAAPGRSIALAPFPDALPATRGEAAQFRRSVPSSDGLIGARATETALRDALGRGGIVHIATHGFMNPRNPMFSRVELAAGRKGTPDDDGRLEVHELLGVTIRSDLVFLSGCETGLGGAWSTAFDRTDDYATLAQAFLYAGARNVVGTLWRINDESAAAFAGRFYGFLEQAAVADALALAQRAMIADTRYAAPYYWAGYQVSGEGTGSTQRR